jgi:hypothetical protein
MYTSLDGLNEFIQGGISGGGGVNSVGSDPEVLLAVVDELPDFFEEMVAFYDKLSQRKAKDMLEVPLGLVLEFLIEIHGKLMELRVRRKEGEVLLLKVCCGLCQAHDESLFQLLI